VVDLFWIVLMIATVGLGIAYHVFGIGRPDLQRLEGTDIFGSVQRWEFRLGEDKQGRRVVTIRVVTDEPNDEDLGRWFYMLLSATDARRLATYLRAAAGPVKAAARSAAPRC